MKCKIGSSIYAYFSSSLMLLSFGNYDTNSKAKEKSVQARVLIPVWL